MILTEKAAAACFSAVSELPAQETVVLANVLCLPSLLLGCS